MSFKSILLHTHGLRGLRRASFSDVAKVSLVSVFRKQIRRSSGFHDSSAGGDLKFKSPGDKFLSPAERSREAFVVRQIIDNGKNRVRALNMELRFELAIGKKIRADASHPDARKLGE
jgi:hypothetical protein